jgi:wyosine [tRNA(Phe)-imidazoG37] synthetase (radical SAM superfamily)
LPIPLQQGIVYGPIRSKRLGRSLGLNLFPPDAKICSFDCAYCHFGLTTEHVRNFADRGSGIGPNPDNALTGIPRVAEVLAAVEEMLMSDHEFDCVAFSGNGEPTLYPWFAELAPKLHDLIHRIRPAVRLALLSNSSTAMDEVLYPAFEAIELRMFKLDAGDQETFEVLNHPCPGIRIADIINGLAALGGRMKITVQTVMVDGPVRNFEGKPFESWISALVRIRPELTQLYTTDRPVADARVTKLTDEQLELIASQIRKLTGMAVQAYY